MEMLIKLVSQVLLDFGYFIFSAKGRGAYCHALSVTITLYNTLLLIQIWNNYNQQSNTICKKSDHVVSE